MIDKVQKFIIQRKCDKIEDLKEKYDMNRQVYEGDSKIKNNSKYFIAKAKYELCKLKLKKINRRIFEKEQNKWKKKDR